jgi:hypothetical protein
MSDLTAADSAAEASQRMVSDAAWVVRRAGELLAEGDAQSAREMVREALGTFGRQPDLLWVLADAEFADEDLIAGRECLDEAVAASPRDSASVPRQIRTLRGGGFWRETLAAVRAVPDALRADPLIRAEAGGFYHACACPAHAVDSYGPRRGLPWASRPARRWCWMRSGGPFGRLRRKAREWEDMCLQDLRRPPAYIDSISGVEGLNDRQVQRIRAQLETNGYRYARRWYGWRALHRAGYRLIPLAVVPVWLVLILIVSLAGFTPGPAGTLGFAAIGAVIAAIPVVVAVRIILTPAGRYRMEPRYGAVIAFPFIVIAAEIAAGEGYARHFLPAGGWSAAVILGLVAAPAALLCLPIAWAVVFIPYLRWSRRTTRQDPLLAAIESLLLVLHDLRSARGYRGIDQRLYHCRHLEFAARCLTRDLLPLSRVSRLGSGTWLARRAAGWAEAIRHVQRQVIASVPDGQRKAEGLLAHDIQCLVTGDLGALAWRDPPSPPPRRATLRRQAISAIRAIVVAVLPLAAVLAAQPFLHASSSLFGWARIATAVWALLYVLLSIDPAIRDKIGAARDLASLMQTAPPPASRDIQHRKAP